LIKFIRANGKLISTPAFFPDATRAVIKSLTPHDLADAGVEGIVINTYHLLFTPGSKIIKKAGGAHKFMNFKGHIISDSGGFQMLSLIHKSKKFGKITDKGIKLTYPGFKEVLFTPEKCIDAQFDLGSDIMICLDDCPGIDASKKEIDESVERTVKWAERCKKRFQENLNKNGNSTNRPLLFAVVQGGSYTALRVNCAKALVKLSFDGYAFGGWPMTRKNELDIKFLKLVSDNTPKNSAKYALGVGKPEEIAKCVKMGYSIFDCVLPTRDARHKRLYVFNKNPSKTKDLTKRSFYGYLDLGKTMYSNNKGPIDKYCSCYACKHYTRSYIHHLFKIKDSLAHRLCTIHNVYMYTTVIKRIRELG